MQTPNWTLVLGEFPDIDDDSVFPDDLEVSRERAVAAAKEISAWFVHIQAVQPAMRLVRLKAIVFMRDCGMTKEEIADQTGMSLHRVNEILKARRNV